MLFINLIGQKTMADKPTKKPVAAKLFDDVKPSSETVAEKSSKPVIIGHTNIIKDPMVSAPLDKPSDMPKNTESSTTPDVDADEKIMVRPNRELRLEPMSQKSEKSTEESDLTEPKDDLSKETTGIKPDENSQPQPSKDNDDEPDDSEVSSNDGGSASGAIDSIVEGVNTKKENALADEKEKARQEEIENMVASKKYFVKISDTPRERNAKLIFGLVLVVLLALAGWYLMMGPGQDLWLKDQTTQNSVAQTSATKPEKSTKTNTAPSTKTYNTPANGVVLEYPSDWQLSDTSNEKIPQIKTITLTSPAQNITVADKANNSVVSEVNARLQIIVEPSKYAELAKLRSCSSTNAVIAGQNVGLIYASSDLPTPQVNQLSLANGLCPTVDRNGYYNIDNNLKLSAPNPDLRYVIISDYIYTSDYLKKLNPNITPSDLAVAQNTGLSMTKDEFMKPATYSQISKILESIKSL